LWQCFADNPSSVGFIGGARKARIPLPHAIGKDGATCGSVVRHDLTRCRAL